MMPSEPDGAASPDRVPPRLDSRGLPPMVEEPAEPPADYGPVLRGRLDPRTLVLVVVRALRNFLIPAIFVLATDSGTSLGVVLLFFLGFSLLQGVIRYFTFSYRVEEGELITREGILERRERNIPLSRVQDVRLEQGLVHRLLGVVDLQVETAGGTGAEASLSVLARSEAERLREAVFTLADQRRTPGGPAKQQGVARDDEVIREVSTRELLLAGITSNRTASAVVILFAGWQLIDDLLPPEKYEALAKNAAGFLERWFSEGGQTNWLAVAGGGVLVLTLGLVVSMAGSLVLFHGFTLSRRGEDLHRSYGLLTRRSSSLPRKRIQLLKIEENWLRRLLGLVTLRADSAGSRPAEQDQSREGRDVLLPVLPSADLPEVLNAALPELKEDQPIWNDVSRCAIRRGTMKGAVVCTLLAILSVLKERAVWAGWPLLLVLPVYFLNVMSYKHLGFALTDRFFRTRRGWLSRATHILPVRNVQTVVLRQNPFDRRFRVCTLVVDSAGQAFTGGGPRTRNVDETVAKQVARDLARKAARTRFRW